MGTATRHLKVRLEPELADALATFARQHGFSLSDAVRSLIRSAQKPSSPSDLHAAVYANLWISELAVQLISSILPEGPEGAALYLDRAAEEACRHLERVELGLAEGERLWR